MRHVVHSLMPPADSGAVLLEHGLSLCGHSLTGRRGCQKEDSHDIRCNRLLGVHTASGQVCLKHVLRDNSMVAAVSE